METLFIPNENDFKKWVKEAVKEYFLDAPLKQTESEADSVNLISRKETAKLLKISLVTLTDWMKRGLPFHKQRGRVYFVKSEVLEYIRENNSRRTRIDFGMLRYNNASVLKFNNNRQRLRNVEAFFWRFNTFFCSKS